MILGMATTPKGEYVKALAKAIGDLELRLTQRDLVNAEIAGLRETVRVLSSRIALTNHDNEKIARLMDMVDYATPSLTDSIRAVLTRAYPRGMTAVQVRNALEESGFNFDDFSNSLSACHAALKRMLNDTEVTPITTNDGKTAYRWILKLTPPPKVNYYSIAPCSATTFSDTVPRIKNGPDPIEDTLKGTLKKRFIKP
jgi:hypothetical protein